MNKKETPVESWKCQWKHRDKTRVLIFPVLLGSQEGTKHHPQVLTFILLSYSLKIIIIKKNPQKINADFQNYLVRMSTFEFSHSAWRNIENVLLIWRQGQTLNQHQARSVCPVSPTLCKKFPLHLQYNVFKVLLSWVRAGWDLANDLLWVAAWSQTDHQEMYKELVMSGC